MQPRGAARGSVYGFAEGDLAASGLQDMGGGGGTRMLSGRAVGGPMRFTHGSLLVPAGWRPSGMNDLELVGRAGPGVEATHADDVGPIVRHQECTGSDVPEIHGSA